MRSGYVFRGRKISRKIKIREYSENVLHAKKIRVIQYVVTNSTQTLDRVQTHPPTSMETFFF